MDAGDPGQRTALSHSGGGHGRHIFRHADAQRALADRPVHPAIGPRDPPPDWPATGAPSGSTS